MDLVIHIEKPFETVITPAPIEKALTETFRQQPTPARSVSVVVTDNQTVQQLNAQYRGLDSPTDVLSFHNEPDPAFPDPTLTDHLGDIIIAYPVAERQAASGGHAPAAEIMLLTVHGALHLLGFDHDTPTRKTAMWQAQQQIMTALELAHIQPTEQ